MIPSQPLMENGSSAALRMGSHMFEFRVIGFGYLYVCTNKMVLSTKRLAKSPNSIIPNGKAVTCC